MKNLDADTALGDIVNSQPGAARVLHGFGLDFCCGGARTLRQACADAGVDRHEVTAALVDLGPQRPADWTAMGPAELVDHIETTHHAYLRRELPRLDAFAEKTAAIHGGRHPELLDVFADLHELTDELTPHLDKEEQVLFPRIRHLAATASPAPPGAPTLAAPISVMVRDHDLTGELLATLRDRTDGYTAPDDACATYRALYDGLAELEADIHLHVHKENNILFPAVLDLEAMATHR